MNKKQTRKRKQKIKGGDSAALFKAIEAGNLKKVNKIVFSEEGKKILEDKNIDGQTPLIYACSQNKNHIVVSLLNAGNKNHIVVSLLNAGADVNGQDSNKNTALNFACSDNNISIVSILLTHTVKHKVDVNIANNDGLVSLHFSADNVEISRLLITAGADVNAKTTKNKTPLHLACLKTNKDVVDLLISHGADVNAMDFKDSTPLHILCRQQPMDTDLFEDSSLDIASLLIEKGANIDAQNIAGIAPLLSSCLNKHNLLSMLLIGRGANINVSDLKGNTPLLFTCFNNNRSLSIVLIEKGADVNAHNNEYLTPLSITCYRGDIQLATIMINAGAYKGGDSCVRYAPLSKLLDERWRGNDLRRMIYDSRNPDEDFREIFKEYNKVDSEEREQVHSNLELLGKKEFSEDLKTARKRRKEVLSRSPIR